MRALVPDLESPHPLGLAMPAIYQDDEFTQRFLSAFDEVLAPVHCVLDNLDSYFDARLAPDDFVSWLAEWVGFALDQNWGIERQRRLVLQAGDLYRWRGTRKGLEEHVAVYTGVTPEIEESGGTSCSSSPGSAPPGDGTFTITVRVKQADHIDPNRLDRLVAAAKPAHLAHRIVVTP